MSFVIYILAAFGLAFVAGYSKISLPARERLALRGDKQGLWLLTLLECPACIGWWTGLLAGIGGGWSIIFDESRPYAMVPRALILAFFTCSTNFLIGRASGLIPEEKERD